ncbi:MAG: ABC transporter ATP-binding protein [Atopobiaceae bacterium]|nr:ABC transporter ATP-binding protein [Atopobiaceae bacterium]
MGEVVLQGAGLRKSFFRAGRDAARRFDAVADVSVALRSGEMCALMGRSGSGKSTLLNMLAGLLTPDEGTVSLSGQDLYALSDEALSRLRNQAIGVIPQGHTALHSLTVFENVELPCHMHGETTDVHDRVDSLLEKLGIAELSNAYPSELSGGELRRVAIARALVVEPQVILADEPTSDLDDENTELVMNALRVASREGRAVLLVTHEQAAATYADRVMRMDAGRIVEGVEA